jgi:predicted TIM-barrel fold metal-dependent hydrolase
MPMIIDIHTHITTEHCPDLVKGRGREPFTAKTLVARMDMEGIDRSVVLPLINPENIENFGVAGNHECLAACRKHRNRLIPFCNIDPRSLLNTPKADFSTLLKTYKDLGCKGIGELCANLPISHPLYKNLFHHAGIQGMPVLFHLTGMRGGTYGVIDKLHLPGLEEVLSEFPDTVFIGHAMAFWGEIDANLQVKDREVYPKGPIKKEGRIPKLLAKYRNLYADLSAGSGYTAVSRDPDFGYRFLQKFNKKLFFGTDRFTSRHEPVPPILPFMIDALRKGRITKDAFENIMHRNFERVFGK